MVGKEYDAATAAVGNVGSVSVRETMLWKLGLDASGTLGIDDEVRPRQPDSGDHDQQVVQL